MLITGEGREAVLTTIQQRVCYTPLVFERVNKKLNQALEPGVVRQLVQRILERPDRIERRGKNYYVDSKQAHVQLTINGSNYRLITVNRI